VGSFNPVFPTAASWLQREVEKPGEMPQPARMLWTRIPAMLGCAAVLLSGCAERDAAPQAVARPLSQLPGEAQPRLATQRLYLGATELTAEIALRPREIMTGMMFRTNVVEGDAMLFVLPRPQRAQFWMMNCPSPLSCAYINPEGVIEEIHDMEPFNTNTIDASSANILFVLETAEGWFTRNNVRTGMLVRTESGSLTETFFRPRTR
jgi:uncharacterized membrane protein (UPF0127 family)